ncbi:MAG: hypothetical protein JJT76_11350 [Clostridiaceae bacterium]|nr:hypothetical protein [Clostridiaceae bacterium]
MKRDKTKLINMIGELIGFYFKIGIMDMDVNLQQGEKETIITLEGDCSNPPIEKLEELKELLNTPRQAEVEDYYSKLLGDDHDYQELNLLGAMVDKASVDYENNKLKITVYKKE